MSSRTGHTQRRLVDAQQMGAHGGRQAYKDIAVYIGGAGEPPRFFTPVDYRFVPRVADIYPQSHQYAYDEAMRLLVSWRFQSTSTKIKWIIRRPPTQAEQNAISNSWRSDRGGGRPLYRPENQPFLNAETSPLFTSWSTAVDWLLQTLRTRFRPVEMARMREAGGSNTTPANDGLGTR